MKRTLSLVPLRNAPALLFEFDDITGVLAGRDASLVAEIIAAVERARFVAIEPHPSSYLLGPAPRSLTDLAAIFGQWYVLPNWLEPSRPCGEASDDDAQVVY